MIIFLLFRSLIMNPFDPNDDVAIWIGQIYLNNKKKYRSELETNLSDTREYEKQKVFEGKHLSHYIYRQIIGNFESSKCQEAQQEIAEEENNELIKLKNPYETNSNNKNENMNIIELCLS